MTTRPDDDNAEGGLAAPLVAKPWVWRDPSTIPPRPYRGGRPVEMDRAPVHVRGEALHPVWWRGRQWAVTAYGIERLDGTYAIEANRLTKNIAHYGWPQHMSGKGWIDSEDFATAWLVGLALHGIQVEGGARTIREALGRAWSPAWRTEADHAGE